MAVCVECIKEKRPTFVERFLKLSRKDSNPHRRNQNPKCYHYTTRQCCFCFVSAKLTIFFIKNNANREKIRKFFM